jgi:NADH-quinone oxidoreductase subunit M
MNFLLYEIFASSMLLLGIILLYVYSPAHSLDIAYISSIAATLPGNVQLAVFMLFFVAFITNMPVFPLHNWLPDAHTEASTQGSMLLSGILTKFGGYGMLLLFLLLPISHSYSPYVAALAIFSSIYGALILLKQKDIKRIIAYSTIVEMGIILLAISAASPSGNYAAAYGMLSHGIVIALAFLSVGILKHLTGERSITRIKGALSSARPTAYAFIIAALAMIGFPLTSGFIADILIFFAALQSLGAYVLIALAGILIMAAYFYNVISKCFLSTSEVSEVKGYVSLSGKVGFSILVVAVILVGILPFIFINLIKI